MIKEAGIIHLGQDLTEVYKIMKRLQEVNRNGRLLRKKDVEA